jgi:hypothetical protein
VAWSERGCGDVAGPFRWSNRVAYVILGRIVKGFVGMLLPLVARATILADLVRPISDGALIDRFASTAFLMSCLPANKFYH